MSSSYPPPTHTLQLKAELINSKIPEELKILCWWPSCVTLQQILCAGPLSSTPHPRESLSLALWVPFLSFPLVLSCAVQALVLLLFLVSELCHWPPRTGTYFNIFLPRHKFLWVNLFRYSV